MRPVSAIILLLSLGILLFVFRFSAIKNARCDVLKGIPSRIKTALEAAHRDEIKGALTR